MTGWLRQVWSNWFTPKNNKHAGNYKGRHRRDGRKEARHE